MHTIKNWAEIKNTYSHANSLIVGNGASISIAPQKFGYDSLYNKCFENNEHSSVKYIFQEFDTNDFEIVLHKLKQCSIINAILKLETNEIDKSYQICKDSLISTIHKVHPEYSDLTPIDLINVANFIGNFESVYYLNYDLLLYWAMYHGNKCDGCAEKSNHPHFFNRLKDCFLKKDNTNYLIFEYDCESKLRPALAPCKNSTLIFYPHGNLSLSKFIAANSYIDVKITSRENSQLNEIFARWGEDNYTPLIVCEGDSKLKLESINSSGYLSYVFYRLEYLLGDKLVVYGWNFDDSDQHIINQIKKANKVKKISNIAVSVYNDQNAQEYMNKVARKLYFLDTPVDFYSSDSPGCWNNSTDNNV